MIMKPIAHFFLRCPVVCQYAAGALSVAAVTSAAPCMLAQVKYVSFLVQQIRHAPQVIQIHKDSWRVRMPRTSQSLHTLS